MLSKKRSCERKDMSGENKATWKFKKNSSKAKFLIASVKRARGTSNIEDRDDTV